MKVWITKYALSDGILEKDAAERRDDGTMITVPWKNGWNEVAYFHKNEWHDDKGTAIARAEGMRVSKIASLKKQIAKLEAMKFS